MNKKQVMMTIVLGALMLLLIFAQKLFDNNFKEVALINSNMGELQEYDIDDADISFSLPNKWTVENIDTSQYDMYKANFKDEENKILGYIEVIKSNEDIAMLAQNDIDNMTLPHDKEKIDNYKSNNRKCIIVNYKTTVKKGYTYINYNYYLPLQNEKVGKISFIVKEDSYKDDMRVIFNSIVDGFITKE